MAAHIIAEEGPKIGLVFDLVEGEEKIIGRDPDEASFVLEDPTVSRRHARFTYAPEGVYLENLSRVSPTLINEEPIDGHVLLKEGDRIQIGRTLFRFSEKEVEKREKREPPAGGYDEIFGTLEEAASEPPPQQLTNASKSNGYDTIFEERIEEEPIPFHLLPETPLLLKVIGGPNMGAEIGLDRGKSYILGKDPLAAEIVFQDLSVSRRHARLTIDLEGLIEIEDLGSKNGTFVNGEAIQGKRAIASQDRVALGTTLFVLIDRDAPQETIYSSAASLSQEKKEEEAALFSEEEIALPEEKSSWREQPIPFKYLLAAGAVAAAALIVFVTLFSLFKAEPVEMAAKDPSHQIQKALTKFEGVQFSYNPASGKLFLVGHLLTAIEAQEMLYRIQELPFVTAVEDNVIIDELVSKMMNDLLSMNSAFRAVTIQALTPGKFSAMGYVESNAQAVQLSEYLSVNFPYLDRLDSQVAVGENIVLQVQGLLQGAGFGAVGFQFANGELLLSGMYSNKLDKEFNAALKEIRAIPGVRAVKNYALPTNPKQAAIDISAQYRVTGTAVYDGKGYSAIVNGKVYEVESLIDGMTITEIDPLTILLEKDGIKYKINYTH